MKRANPDPEESPPSEYWLNAPTHRRFLLADARSQLAFFEASLAGDGIVRALDRAGHAVSGPQELHATARLVHSYALADIAGYDGAKRVVDAALCALRRHRDDVYDGYIWSIAEDGTPNDDRKLAYGHVFVLLAGASATMAGHPDGRRILDEAAAILDDKFWDDDVGRLREEFGRDWSAISTYRGMNANMHGVEAMLTAFEATGDWLWLERADRILAFFVDEIAPVHDWVLPEHFTAEWEVHPDYDGDPMFRPAGTTPGHSLELARLAIQHWDLAGRPSDERPAKARALIETALRTGWRDDGGFAYTLNHERSMGIVDRYWWPVTEAIGAMATLIKLDGRPEDEAWYRHLWIFASTHFVDHERGGWIPQIDEEGRPAEGPFYGKPDIYHALQADLFPLVPALSHLGHGLQNMLVSVDGDI